MATADTVNLIKKDLVNVGIKNPYLNAAILSVIKKESNFIPKAESSYKNTSNARLRQIFVSKLKGIPEETLTKLKADDEKFYNLIYGNVNGNTSFKDAFAYRGRGLNQLTFKGAYKAYGDLIGEDLVKNPDKVNEIPTASKIAANYFKIGLNQGLKKGSFKKFGVEKPEDISDLDKALLVAFQINAGLGTNMGTQFFKDSIAKAKTTIKDFLTTAEQATETAIVKTEDKIKDNKILTGVLAIGFFFTLYLLVNKK